MSRPCVPTSNATARISNGCWRCLMQARCGRPRFTATSSPTRPMRIASARRVISRASWCLKFADPPRRSRPRKTHRYLADRIERVGNGVFVAFNHERRGDRSGNDGVSVRKPFAKGCESVRNGRDDIDQLAGECFRVRGACRLGSAPDQTRSKPDNAATRPCIATQYDVTLVNVAGEHLVEIIPVSYTHLTLPTILRV